LGNCHFGYEKIVDFDQFLGLIRVNESVDILCSNEWSVSTNLYNKTFNLCR